MSCKPTYKGIRYDSIEELRDVIDKQALQAYSAYLDSKGITDIGFHHSETEIEQFKDDFEEGYAAQKGVSSKAIFFLDKPAKEEFLSKRPFVGAFGLKMNNAWHLPSSWDRSDKRKSGIKEGIDEALEQGKDSAIFDNIWDNKIWTTLKVVFSSKQIEKLGSKQDIEGFKEFVKNNSNDQFSEISFQGNNSSSPASNQRFSQLLNRLGKSINDVNVTIASPETIETILKTVTKNQDLKLPNGTIYGFTYTDKNGKEQIVLNENNLNLETPIHEYAHILEKLFPDLFKEGIKEFKDSVGFKKALAEVQANDLYKNKTLEEQQVEALVTLIGKKGVGYYEKGPLLSKFKAWLSKLFKTISDKIAKLTDGKLGYKITADDKLNFFINDRLNDLLHAKNVKEKRKALNDSLKALIDVAVNNIDAFKGIQFNVPYIDGAENRKIRKKQLRKIYRDQESNDILDHFSPATSADIKDVISFLRNKIPINSHIKDILELYNGELTAAFYKQFDPLKEEKEESSEIPLRPDDLLKQIGYEYTVTTTLKGARENYLSYYKGLDYGKPDKDGNCEVICTLNSDSVRFNESFVTFVVRDDAKETPHAHDLTQNNLTQRWKDYLTETGRKNEDGTYNLKDLNPNSLDPYSTSVMSLQISKKGKGLKSVSRYNHTLGSPDTIYKDLDKLINGLHKAFYDFFGEKIPDGSQEDLPNGIIISDNQLYVVGSEENGVDYGEGFYRKPDGTIVILEKNERMIDGFVIKEDGTINDAINNEMAQRSFPFNFSTAKFSSSSNTIQLIGENYTIDITTKNGQIQTIHSNTFNGDINENSLRHNKNLISINLPLLKNIDNSSVHDNPNLVVINIPSVVSIDHNTLNRNGVFVLNMPALITTGVTSLNGNSNLIEINAPKLETIGRNTLEFNYKLKSINVPSLKLMNYSNFSYNDNITTIIALNTQVSNEDDRSFDKKTALFWKRQPRGVATDNKNLKTVILPKATTFDSADFNDAKKLETIIAGSNEGLAPDKKAIAEKSKLTRKLIDDVITKLRVEAISMDNDFNYTSYSAETAAMIKEQFEVTKKELLKQYQELENDLNDLLEQQPNREEESSEDLITTEDFMALAKKLMSDINTEDLYILKQELLIALAGGVPVTGLVRGQKVYVKDENGKVNVKTVRHELFHRMFSHYLKVTDRAQLIKSYEETYNVKVTDLAAFEQDLARRFETFKPKLRGSLSFLERFLNKIYAFIGRITKHERDIRNLFLNIEAGNYKTMQKESGHDAAWFDVHLKDRFYEGSIEADFAKENENVVERYDAAYNTLSTMLSHLERNSFRIDSRSKKLILVTDDNNKLAGKSSYELYMQIGKLLTEKPKEERTKGEQILAEFYKKDKQEILVKLFTEIMPHFALSISINKVKEKDIFDDPEEAVREDEDTETGTQDTEAEDTELSTNTDLSKQIREKDRTNYEALGASDLVKAFCSTISYYYRGKLRTIDSRLAFYKMLQLTANVNINAPLPDILKAIKLNIGREGNNTVTRVIGYRLYHLIETAYKPFLELPHVDGDYAELDIRFLDVDTAAIKGDAWYEDGGLDHSDFFYDGEGNIKGETLLRMMNEGKEGDDLLVRFVKRKPNEPTLDFLSRVRGYYNAPEYKDATGKINNEAVLIEMEKMDASYNKQYAINLLAQIHDTFFSQREKNFKMLEKINNYGYFSMKYQDAIPLTVRQAIKADIISVVANRENLIEMDKKIKALFASNEHPHDDYEEGRKKVLEVMNAPSPIYDRRGNLSKELKNKDKYTYKQSLALSLADFTKDYINLSDEAKNDMTLFEYLSSRKDEIKLPYLKFLSFAHILLRNNEYIKNVDTQLEKLLNDKDTSVALPEDIFDDPKITHMLAAFVTDLFGIVNPDFSDSSRGEIESITKYGLDMIFNTKGKIDSFGDKRYGTLEASVEEYDAGNSTEDDSMNTSESVSEVEDDKNIETAGGDEETPLQSVQSWLSRHHNSDLNRLSTIAAKNNDYLRVTTIKAADGTTRYLFTPSSFGLDVLESLKALQREYYNSNVEKESNFIRHLKKDKSELLEHSLELFSDEFYEQNIFLQGKIIEKIHDHDLTRYGDRITSYRDESPAQTWEREFMGFLSSTYSGGGSYTEFINPIEDRPNTIGVQVRIQSDFRNKEDFEAILKQLTTRKDFSHIVDYDRKSLINFTVLEKLINGHYDNTLKLTAEEKAALKAYNNEGQPTFAYNKEGIKLIADLMVRTIRLDAIDTAKTMLESGMVFPDDFHKIVKTFARLRYINEESANIINNMTDGADSNAKFKKPTGFKDSYDFEKNTDHKRFLEALADVVGLWKVNSYVNNYSINQLIAGDVAFYPTSFGKIKRAGGYSAPGNRGIVNKLLGIPEEVSVLIIEDPLFQIRNGALPEFAKIPEYATAKPYSYTDGDDYMLPERLDMLKLMYGSDKNLGAVIKSAYFHVTDSPLMLKSSTVVLSDDLVNQPGNEKLKILRDNMRKIGAMHATFPTVTKTGGIKTQATTENVFELFTDKEADEHRKHSIIKIKNKYFKIQGTPLHLEEEQVSNYSQLPYFLNMGQDTIEEAKLTYQAMADLYEIGLDRAKERFKNDEAIRNEIMNAASGKNAADFQDLISSGMDLNFPLVTNRALTYLASSFSKIAIQYKFKGGKLVLQSDWGMNHPTTGERLMPRIINGQLTYETLLPSYMKAYINEGDIIGVRIPTTDIHSGTPLHVVGFYDDSNSNMAVVPRELIAIVGFDFDVDSIFVIRRERNSKKYVSMMKKEEMASKQIEPELFEMYKKANHLRYLTHLIKTANESVAKERKKNEDIYDDQREIDLTKKGSKQATTIKYDDAVAQLKKLREEISAYAAANNITFYNLIKDAAEFKKTSLADKVQTTKELKEAQELPAGYSGTEGKLKFDSKEIDTLKKDYKEALDSGSENTNAIRTQLEALLKNQIIEQYLSALQKKETRTRMLSPVSVGMFNERSPIGNEWKELGLYKEGTVLRMIQDLQLKKAGLTLDSDKKAVRNAIRLQQDFDLSDVKSRIDAIQVVMAGADLTGIFANATKDLAYTIKCGQRIHEKAVTKTATVYLDELRLKAITKSYKTLSDLTNELLAADVTTITLAQLRAYTEVQDKIQYILLNHQSSAHTPNTIEVTVFDETSPIKHTFAPLLRTPIRYGGKSYGQLQDTAETLKLNDALINAAIDNLKEQILYAINANQITAEALVAAIYIGIPINDITLLLKQEVIKNLNITNLQRTMESLKKELATAGIDVKKFNDFLESDDATSPEFGRQLDFEMLEDNYGEPNSRNNLFTRYKIVKLFSKLEAFGGEMANVASAVSGLKNFSTNMEDLDRMQEGWDKSFGNDTFALRLQNVKEQLPHIIKMKENFDYLMDKIIKPNLFVYSGVVDKAIKEGMGNIVNPRLNTYNSAKNLQAIKNLFIKFAMSNFIENVDDKLKASLNITFTTTRGNEITKTYSGSQAFVQRIGEQLSNIKKDYSEAKKENTKRQQDVVESNMFLEGLEVTLSSYGFYSLRFAGGTNLTDRDIYRLKRDILNIPTGWDKEKNTFSSPVTSEELLKNLLYLAILQNGVSAGQNTYNKALPTQALIEASKEFKSNIIEQMKNNLPSVAERFFIQLASSNVENLPFITKKSGVLITTEDAMGNKIYTGEEFTPGNHFLYDLKYSMTDITKKSNFSFPKIIANGKYKTAYIKVYESESGNVYYRKLDKTRVFSFEDVDKPYSVDEFFRTDIPYLKVEDFSIINDVVQTTLLPTYSGKSTKVFISKKSQADNSDRVYVDLITMKVLDSPEAVGTPKPAPPLPTQKDLQQEDELNPCPIKTF